MNASDFTGMTPAELQQYIDSHKEKEYLLVDVRQPNEYETGHLPGAKLIPVMELVANLYDLPADRDLIFYCRSGGRSVAAAALAVEAAVTRKRIYNMAGGIMAWSGRQLADYPKVRIFDTAAPSSQLLLTAINLEKGAMQFYKHLVRRFSEHDVSKVFAKLVDAEIAHAKTIYDIWKSGEKKPLAFETLFDQMDGDILEGGDPLPDMLKRIMAIEDEICMSLLELALQIEYSALDLYKTMAERMDVSNARSAFFAIAQAEKAHMKVLITATGEC